MSATLFFVPRERVVDANGLPIAGAKLTFYAAGTVNLLDTYSDVALTVPNANPVVATAGGLFGPIYLKPVAYYVKLTTSADVLVWDQDNYIPSPAGSAWNIQPYDVNDYSATGGGTWTVDAGDLVNFRYVLQGNILFLELTIDTSSIVAVVSDIRIK